MKLFERIIPGNGDRSNLFENKKKPIEIPSAIKEEEEIRKDIIGQSKAVENFAVLKKIIESGIRPKKGPIHSEWLSGPSGVGKTEIVKKLVDMFLKDHPQADKDGNLIENDVATNHLIRIDGGSYQTDHEISKVIGSAPGLVGSGGDTYVEPLFSKANIERNSVYYTDASGKQRKVCFILIDEAEKAHPALHKALLSALDDGVITLNNNEKVDLSDCVILFTSNLGTQEVRDAQQNGDTREPEEIYKDAYKEHFPAEFLGRIRKMTVFETLTKEEVKQIVSLRATDIEKAFAYNDIKLKIELTSETIDWLVEHGYSELEGARALQKLMHENIQTGLIRIGGEYKLDGETIIVDINSDHSGLEFHSSKGDLKPLPKKPRETKPNPRPEEKPNSGSNGSGPEQVAGIFTPENVSQLVNESVKSTLNEKNRKRISELANELLKYREQDSARRAVSANFNSINGKKLKSADDLIEYLEAEIKRLKN